MWVCVGSNHGFQDQADGVAMRGKGPREGIVHEVVSAGVEVHISDAPADLLGVGDGCGGRLPLPDWSGLAAVVIAPSGVGAEGGADRVASVGVGDEVDVVGHEAEGHEVGDRGDEAIPQGGRFIPGVEEE